MQEIQQYFCVTTFDTSGGIEKFIDKEGTLLIGDLHCCEFIQLEFFLYGGDLFFGQSLDCLYVIINFINDHAPTFKICKIQIARLNIKMRKVLVTLCESPIYTKRLQCKSITEDDDYIFQNRIAKILQNIIPNFNYDRFTKMGPRTREILKRSLYEIDNGEAILITLAINLQMEQQQQSLNSKHSLGNYNLFDIDITSNYCKTIIIALIMENSENKSIEELQTEFCSSHVVIDTVGNLIIVNVNNAEYENFLLVCSERRLKIWFTSDKNSFLNNDDMYIENIARLFLYKYKKSANIHTHKEVYVVYSLLAKCSCYFRKKPLRYSTISTILKDQFFALTTESGLKYLNKNYEKPIVHNVEPVLNMHRIFLKPINSGKFSPLNYNKMLLINF